jgi:hypothetical protein
MSVIPPNPIPKIIVGYHFYLRRSQQEMVLQMQILFDLCLILIRKLNWLDYVQS